MASKSTDKAVWVLFVAKGGPSFPNFYPIAAYETRDEAIKVWEGLPVGPHYQLFEIPLGKFFGVIDGNQIDSRLGNLDHEHLYEEEEEDSEGTEE